MNYGRRSITIVNQHPSLGVSLSYLKKKSREILMLLGFKNVSLEITLTTDAFVRKQNLKFRNKNESTDVLSFPQWLPQKKLKQYEGKFLGDILISLDQAERQAVSQNIKLRDEVIFLTLHSVLHLVGYDHATKRDLTKMQKKESSLWLKIK